MVKHKPTSIKSSIVPTLKLLLLTTIVLSLSILPITGVSSKSKKKRKRQSLKSYVQKYKRIAIAEMKRTGIPASITLAQGVIESDSGNSYLVRKASNHFGIKCHSSWKGRSVKAKDDRRGECFRKYSSSHKSYVDHSNFLIRNDRYRKLFKLKTTNYRGWAKGLRKAGYATNKKYDRLLVSIIKKYKLYKYDKIVNVKHPKASSSKKKTKRKNKKSATKANIKKRNGVKAIKTKRKSSAKQIANDYKVKLDKLLKYNNWRADKEIPANTLVFLKQLKKKAPKEMKYHQVKSKEKMDDISKKYGVKLKSLYKYNRMKSGQEPLTGEVIYLRKKAPKAPKLQGSKKQLSKKTTAKKKETATTKKKSTASKNKTNIKPLTKETAAKKEVTKTTVAKKKTKETAKTTAAKKKTKEAAKTTASKQKSRNTRLSLLKKETKEISQEPKVVIHKVTKGNTLYSIAKKYNTTISTLKKHNNIKKDKLAIGQTLLVATNS